MAGRMVETSDWWMVARRFRAAAPSCWDREDQSRRSLNQHRGVRPSQCCLGSADRTLRAEPGCAGSRTREQDGGKYQVVYGPPELEWEGIGERKPSVASPGVLSTMGCRVASDRG